jgi:hypothetical protein
MGFITLNSDCGPVYLQFALIFEIVMGVGCFIFDMTALFKLYKMLRKNNSIAKQKKTQEKLLMIQVKF